MKKFILFILFTLFFDNVFASNKIKVISSFSILGDIVKQVGKDKIEVTNIVKDNQSIHSYKLSSYDIKIINSAKIIFINGLHLESNSFLNAIKNSNIIYKEASEGIDPIIIHGDIIDIKEVMKFKSKSHAAERKHYIDPHVWQDPILVVKYAENIANSLIKIDPKNKDYYLNNLKEYSKKLINLDTLIKNNLSKIPQYKRNILISHDYLNYFARRYKINVISVDGLNEDSHVSAKKIKDIVKLVRNKNVKAIFIENINNNGTIQQIVREANKKISGKLYTDALSSSVEPANNYLNMIKYNSDTIYKSLK